MGKSRLLTTVHIYRLKQTVVNTETLTTVHFNRLNTAAVKFQTGAIPACEQEETWQELVDVERRVDPVILGPNSIEQFWLEFQLEKRIHTILFHSETCLNYQFLNFLV